MNRRVLNTLIVDDNDLDCKKKSTEITLDDINLGSLGFIAQDLEKYDLIIYQGTRGRKILRLR